MADETTVDKAGWLTGTPPPSDLTILDHSRVIVSLKPDGTVELGLGVTPNAAALAFWTEVRKVMREDAVVAAERERCAKIAESLPPPPDYKGDGLGNSLALGVHSCTGKAIAARIRSPR